MRTIFTHPDPKKVLTLTLANSTIFGIKAENSARSIKVIVVSQSPLKLPVNIPTELGVVTLEAYYAKGSKTPSLEVPAYTTDAKGEKHGFPVIASIIVPTTPESLILNAQIQGLKDYIEYLTNELKKTMPAVASIPAFVGNMKIDTRPASGSQAELDVENAELNAEISKDDLPF